MASKKQTPDPAQVELPLFHPPTVIFPTVSIRQPDGSMLSRPGKGVVVGDYITAREAAKIMDMSLRWIDDKCSSGELFPSSYKPGGSGKSHWRLLRSEVLARKGTLPTE